VRSFADHLFGDLRMLRGACHVEVLERQFASLVDVVVTAAAVVVDRVVEGLRGNRCGCCVYGRLGGLPRLSLLRPRRAEVGAPHHGQTQADRQKRRRKLPHVAKVKLHPFRAGTTGVLTRVSCF
jgi:hypothetical protein